MSFSKVVIIFCFLFVINESLAQQKDCAQVLKDLQTKSVVDKKDLSLILQEVYPDSVKPFLVNNQIDFRSQDEYGGTILHELAGRGYVEAVDLVLRLKEGIINVNAQDYGGQTPLLIAAWRGHLPLVKSLSKNRRVNMKMRNKLGQTALHLSSKGGHLNVLRFLQKDGRIDIDAKNEFGWTPLHEATNEDHLEIVKFLVTNSLVDLNAKTVDGKTILHLSAFLGYFDIVDFLLADGRMDVHAQDEYGHTALDKSEFAKLPPTYLIIVEFLQQSEILKGNDDLAAVSLSSVEGFLHKNQKIIELLKATQVIH